MNRFIQVITEIEDQRSALQSIIDAKKEEIIKFLDHLDDDDDVQNFIVKFLFFRIRMFLFAPTESPKPVKYFRNKNELNCEFMYLLYINIFILNMNCL